jgi:hypothetical protein
MKKLSTPPSNKYLSEHNTHSRNTILNKLSNFKKTNLVSQNKKPTQIEIFLSEESTFNNSDSQTNVRKLNLLSIVQNNLEICSVKSSTNTNSNNFNNSNNQNSNNTNNNSNASEQINLINFSTLSQENTKYKQENEYLLQQIKTLNLEKDFLKEQALKLIKKNSETEEHIDLLKSQNSQFDIFESKFEEISESFFFILEKIKHSHTGLIEDNKKLKELIIFILQCFNIKEFEALEYIINYVKQNETFCGKVDFPQPLVNFWNNNLEGKNALNKNYDSFIGFNDLRRTKLSPLYSPGKTPIRLRSSNTIAKTPKNRLHTTTELNFDDLKFIKHKNTDSECSLNSSKVINTRSKSIKLPKRMNSYSEKMKLKTISLPLNTSMTPKSLRIRDYNVNVNNPQIYLNNTILLEKNDLKESKNSTIESNYDTHGKKIKVCI